MSYIKYFFKKYWKRLVLAVLLFILTLGLYGILKNKRG
jgi:hypothetical protein